MSYFDNMTVEQAVDKAKEIQSILNEKDAINLLNIDDGYGGKIKDPTVSKWSFDVRESGGDLEVVLTADCTGESELAGKLSASDVAGYVGKMATSISDAEDYDNDEGNVWVIVGTVDNTEENQAALSKALKVKMEEDSSIEDYLYLSEDDKLNARAQDLAESITSTIHSITGSDVDDINSQISTNGNYFRYRALVYAPYPKNFKFSGYESLPKLNDKLRNKVVTAVKSFLESTEFSLSVDAYFVSNDNVFNLSGYKVEE